MLMLTFSRPGHYLMEIYQHAITNVVLISELPFAKQWKFPK